MRQSEASLALIQRWQDGQIYWLAQWNDKWSAFSFVGGHRRPGESFRECLLREIAEELHLREGTDYKVSPEPPAHWDFVDFSRSAQTQTRYIMDLFDVELARAAHSVVNGNPANRWLTRAEIDAGRTEDGRPVSATMKRMFGEK